MQIKHIEGEITIMIKIVTDSSTLYRVDEANKRNIDIAPLSVTIDGKTYLENEEINSEEFIEIINKGHVPVSSQPSVGNVIDIYNKYPEDEIINITIADGLSGTYSSACMAKNLCDHSERIEVINSKTLCATQRYIVDTAVKLVQMGKSKTEIVDEVNKLIETSKSFLIPNDFDYLVRGGRLSSLAGKIAGVMKLFPIVTLAEDSKSLVKFSTKRTLKKAIEKICDELIENGVDSTYKIFISHGCAEELAQTAKNIINEKIPGVETETYKLGPAFITQGGPNCVAIQSIEKYI